MTTKDGMPPRQPDDEPFGSLLIDAFDLIDQAVGEITDAEVDDHLRRVLRQSGRSAQASTISPAQTPQEDESQWLPTRIRPVDKGAARAARTGRRQLGRRRFPARTLHVIDIENLVGSAIPTTEQVRDVEGWYTQHIGFGPDDMVVIAASHLGLLNVALGWPHARYRVRSGPDGADLELLDVLLHEDIPNRFTHVVLGSTDRIFGPTSQSLAARGVKVTVVHRRDKQSLEPPEPAEGVQYLQYSA
jgi:hypothetical protein